MADSISGPGILFVRSRLSPTSPTPLPEPLFLTWYDSEHIPEVVASSGIASGFRYLDVDKTSPFGNVHNNKPFLAFYPMADLAFTQGDEFRGIRVKSDLLPGSGVVYDMAEFDVGYLGFVGKAGEGGKGGAAFVVTVGIRPEGEVGGEEVEEYYGKQIGEVAKVQGYVRSLRFKLLYARTNAQSRKLKGLPPAEEEMVEMPTWLAIHEFKEVPGEEVLERLRTDPGEVMREKGWGKTEIETHAWRLDRVHGEGKFFE
ncbi:hypothetical protein IQ07DRAFT_683311 [Pyrenochaeta sp. DS3sAY3a]|nr:hypothetical protein IQ07DRAFT_683311 [Pyrenochaeta sp. DS3sAY3a]